jgi:hypothetical protein
MPVLFDAGNSITAATPYAAVWLTPDEQLNWLGLVEYFRDA